MTPQPPHITADYIYINVAHSKYYLQNLHITITHNSKEKSDALKLKQKIIQGLEYTDNPNVLVGLKLIDEVKKSRDKAKKELDKYVNRCNIIPSSFKGESRFRNDSSYWDLKYQYKNLQSLLDKAEGKTS